MGSYYIPSNNLKGESRILNIFTVKSLLFTAAGGLIGLVFYFIIGVLLGLNTLGIGIGVLFALIGYGIATIKIPTGNSYMSKNVGGDSIDDIIMRYILFKKNKRVYTYSIERKEPDYVSMSDKLNVMNIVGKMTTSNKTNTKEEK